MSGKTFNVLYLGAGRISFGSTEASWNHSIRIEKKLGNRLKVVAIVDVNKAHAENIIAQKRAVEDITASWKDTVVFKSIEQASKELAKEDHPHLIVNGLPANFRGTSQPGKDNDSQCARHFPGVAQFIEKPISGAPIEEVEKVNQALKAGGGYVSVGYMLRYLKAVAEMKKIIKDNNLTVMVTQATYLMAYKWAGQADKPMGYWDLNDELGPVVGQGTHLVDLTRYFCPNVIEDSLHVHTIEASDKAGHLSYLKNPKEAQLPAKDKIPRVTNAIWLYENGATGSFIHGACLGDGDYDCELVIIADGWKLRLVDPYGTAPRLHVRRPDSPEETRTVFTADDCYYTEFSNLIDVIEGKADASAILSPWQDAMDTYKFTWAIRLAGEEAARKRGARP